MIAGLRGRPLRFGPQKVYLEAGAVVYEVHVPLNVFESLQRGPARVFLHVHHHHSQDGERLYGFLDAAQRDFFGLLHQVKGLGPALALSVLSHMDGETLLDVCEAGDPAPLLRIPRVGKATAERMVFEIGRKGGKWRRTLALGAPGAAREEDGTEAGIALQAMLQLGYREPQIRAAMSSLSKEGPGPGNAAEWIHALLRTL